MKSVILWGVLSVSLILILVILFRRKIGFKWISSFGVHLVLAALGIYVVNYSGLIGEVNIPINPATIGTVTVLGLPGVALLYGLKISLF
ncbi:MULTISPECIES: pro-sigmaK processing inhibitor BofA family protein [unclassified Paenibacillus]|uniref:Pro-sigmaK processing inhibitor BofA family protein n=1 Tax=Paenibacillus provencensis TaxID=441151 RepID=A0ABW3PWB7_9BACL|nr:MULTISPECIES: pro-sigmaK processing inhibitor BofA family protein [unclassified Paenibacillus]MCM3130877.1 pro-sigmaK processing inhibitor BofA family protein [Paenibacillus sp. MER 78]SFS98056.1 inhibitor of the pro-sigma K processing machinery [Paenibacillus sp. 453mf]